MIKNIIKSLFAGILIGLAGSMFLLAKSQGFSILPALLFPVGLYLICSFSFNLYTGKIGFVFDNEKKLKIYEYIIMLVLNFVGAVLIGLIFNLIFNKNDLLIYVASQTAQTKFGDITFINCILVLLKSTICGMFVYIAVFLYNKTNNDVAKALGVWIPIFTFAYLGLDHSIANMFYMSAGLEFTLSAFVYILIAIIGNSIGAIIFDFVKRKIL